MVYGIRILRGPGGLSLSGIFEFRDPGRIRPVIRVATSLPGWISLEPIDLSTAVGEPRRLPVLISIRRLKVGPLKSFCCLKR
jgi:hypothetical protein